MLSKKENNILMLITASKAIVHWKSMSCGPMSDHLLMTLISLTSGRHTHRSPHLCQTTPRLYDCALHRRKSWFYSNLLRRKTSWLKKTRPPKKTCVGLCFNFRIFFVDLNMHSFGELKRADLKITTSAFRKTLKTHTHTAHADIHRNMSDEGSLSHTQHSSHFLWK